MSYKYVIICSISFDSCFEQMIVATEPEDYTEDIATALLIPFGDAKIKAATETLSKRNAISKVSKNRASKSYRMSEA